MKKTFTKISIVLMFLAALPAAEISAQTNKPEYAAGQSVSTTNKNDKSKPQIVNNTLTRCGLQFANDNNEYTVGDNVVYIGGDYIGGDNGNSYYPAFQGNNGLKKITLGRNTTSIGKHAFEGTSLQNIDFNYQNKVLSSVDDNAFAYNNNLFFLQFPKSLKSLGGYVFTGCPNLSSIELYNTEITAVGSNTFAGLGKIKSIALPVSVKTIGSYAFSGTSLDYFTLPFNFDYSSNDNKNAFSNSKIQRLNIAFSKRKDIYNFESFLNNNNIDTKTIIFLPIDLIKYTLNLGDVNLQQKETGIDYNGFTLKSVESSPIKSRVWTPFTHSYPVKYIRNGVERFFRVEDGTLNLNSKDFGEGIRVLQLVEVTSEVTGNNGYVPANFPLLVFCNNRGKDGKVTWEIVGYNENTENNWKNLYGKDATYLDKDGNKQELKYTKNGETWNAITYNPLVGTPAAARVGQFAESDENNNYYTENSKVGGYENFELVYSNKYSTGYYKTIVDAQVLDGEKSYLRLRLYGKDDEHPDVPVIDPQPGLGVVPIKKIRMLIDDSDTPTGITDIDADTDAVNAFNNHGDGRWYRLDGTSTDSKPAAPGLYIYNGKKIVIGK